FLQEILRWEGRGDHRSYSACPSCRVDKAEFRCNGCLGGGEMLCRSCLLERHKQNPFHRVEHWTCNQFERKTLKELGLRIQLGHWYGRDRRCPAPQPAAGDTFVIIHDHGVHEVSLDFCGCGTGGAHEVQLLRAQLFPATGAAPRTAATFSVLECFHILSFESKSSTYEFYHSLVRETDNTGLKKTPNRYHEFRRLTREWNHLEMLKRAGRCHHPEGAAGTQPGECALLCPACPHPGKNLPPNWKDVSPERQFLYALFLAMDANFRLKRKDVSSEEKDPGLGDGWAFFGEVKRYMAHLAEHWDQPQDRSTCVAHDAVDKPDREARGTASSGIGAVDCARHNMKRPLAVGDLQFGERYINMDWMFFRSVVGTELMRFFVSYDIACQWHINIWRRMSGYEQSIQLVGGHRFIVFLVPKFHLPAHIEACNLRFSFNLTRDVGQTDGEAPERGWANANPLANSTAEMGPGARRDTLNDHFNDWNHKKIIAFGAFFFTKFALDDMEESLSLADVMCNDGESRERKGTVEEWTEMAERWEKDPDAPNPFETRAKDDHLAQVRKDLAEEAAAREAAGMEDAGAVRDDMHITEMLSMGLQLEEQQRALGFDIASTGLHPTADQRRTMLERTSKLRRKIFAWMEKQTPFMPRVAWLRDQEDAARARTARTQPVPGVKVHEIQLWLPSAMMARHQASDLEWCTREAIEFEYRLRVGQANEALHDIRRQLLVRTNAYKYKDRHARGVRANTRSGDKIDALNDRIRRSAEQYRAARRGLVVLGQTLEMDKWERTLKPLKEEDVRGMPRAMQAKKRRVKDKELSWIWVVQGKDLEAGMAPAMNEALRIEWAKARARWMRWAEEVDLLEEEMRRIKQFLTWRAGWWQTQIDRRGLPDGPQREGETAYALRQASFQAALCTDFADKWKDLPELIRKGRAGEQELPADTTTLRKTRTGTLPVVDSVASGSGPRVAMDDGSDDDSEEGDEPVPAPRWPLNPAYID
ncbi:hypothetical protein B0H10DRAFT_1856886, partial [Mycena sp. CBHHK59/15]